MYYNGDNKEKGTIPGRLEIKANALILILHFLILIHSTLYFLYYYACVSLSASNTVFNQNRTRIKNMSRKRSGDTQVKLPSSIYIPYHGFDYTHCTIRCARLNIVKGSETEKIS